MEHIKPMMLVEDDAVDAMTVKRAIRELDLDKPVVHVTNGEEALQYLHDPQFDEPDIILLDLNMPRMGGLEFLKALRADPARRAIPVVVLTTSSNATDIAESFDLNVSGYMVKPVDYDHFVEMMSLIERYWTLSQLPVKV